MSVRIFRVYLFLGHDVRVPRRLSTHNATTQFHLASFCDSENLSQANIFIIGRKKHIFHSNGGYVLQNNVNRKVSWSFHQTGWENRNHNYTPNLYKC